MSLINESNKLLNNCISASCVDILKIIDVHLIRAGYVSIKMCLTNEKLMASLSICHLTRVALGAIL